MTSLKSARRTVKAVRSPRAETAFSARKPVPDDFTPNEREKLSATSRINAELSTHPAATQKTSKIPFHSIPTRLDKYNLQGKLDHPFRTPESPESTEHSNDDRLFVNFDLLKTMTPRNCLKCLSSTPLFLRTLCLEGRLDPDLVSSVALSLTQSELQKFMLNMTEEVNLYCALNACQSIPEIEEQMVALIPIDRATVWIKSESSNFVMSQTMKESLEVGQTILTEAFENKQDIVMGDPGNFRGFSVDFDLPLLRGVQSMMLLPIANPNDEVVAVLQCCGFKNEVAAVQSEFPPYYIDVLRIVRDLAQRKFFSAPLPRTVPSNISNVFTDIENCSLQKTSRALCKFLQNAFPCELAELFEFDDRYRVLIRLTDGQRFLEGEGGVSFQAGIIAATINVANNQNHPQFRKEIDGQLVNHAILSRSLHQGRDHFVVTLRAKPNLPAFTTNDVKLLGELSPVVCDTLRLARWLERRDQERTQSLRDLALLNLCCESLACVASQGLDRWATVQAAAKQIFDCETLFICLFDGRYMKFFPTEVQCKFEECAAGTAYNYRDSVVTSVDDDKAKVNPPLYRLLGVQLESSLAFPYRVNGKVAGAIEIINPKKSDVTVEVQKLFSNLCSCIMCNAH
jgi:hypothetical protein